MTPLPKPTAAPTARELNQLIVTLYREGRDMRLHNFQDWALERVRNLIHFDSAWWGYGDAVALRVKRGLGAPGRPGVYAKDSVYLRGRMGVHRWLEAGGQIEHLYVGKVGTSDPVMEWISQEWVQLRAVPELWRSKRAELPIQST